MSSADALDAILDDFRSIPDQDRRAILRRLTLAERTRVEALLQSPSNAGTVQYSDAILERIAAASSLDHMGSGMTPAGRDALVRAARADGLNETIVPPATDMRRGGSLADAIGGAFRRGLRR